MDLWARAYMQKAACRLLNITTCISDRPLPKYMELTTAVSYRATYLLFVYFASISSNLGIFYLDLDMGVRIESFVYIMTT
jgi:hypothetical protein